MSQVIANAGPSVAVAAAPRAAAPARGRSLSWLLAAYLVARMFMVFKSGLPQPADLALLAMFALYLRPVHGRWLWSNARPYVLFVGWVVIVNGLWGLFRFRFEYGTHASYYVYNLALVALVATTRFQYRDRFDAAMRGAVLVAGYAQMGLALRDGSVFRVEGTFNNANQLAFWSLCLASTYLVVRRPKMVLWDVVVLAPLVYCQLVSTSRAGIIGLAVLVLVWVYEVSVRSPYRLVVWGAVLVALILVPTAPRAVDYLADLEVVERLEARFNKDSSVDEVELRNTDRISKYYEYAVLGAGEGDYERFPYSLPIEIHSTPMTILFSYGLIGVALFGSFISGLSMRLWWTHRVILAALFLYSVTHNGLRFAFFWLAIGTLVAEDAHLRWSRRLSALRGDTRPRVP